MRNRQNLLCGGHANNDFRLPVTFKLLMCLVFGVGFSYLYLVSKTESLSREIQKYEIKINSLRSASNAESYEWNRLISPVNFTKALDNFSLKMKFPEADEIIYVSTDVRSFVEESLRESISFSSPERIVALKSDADYFVNSNPWIRSLKANKHFIDRYSKLKVNPLPNLDIETTFDKTLNYINAVVIGCLGSLISALLVYWVRKFSISVKHK
jgi:hypothetical protein